MSNDFEYDIDNILSEFLDETTPEAKQAGPQQFDEPVSDQLDELRPQQERPDRERSAPEPEKKDRTLPYAYTKPDDQNRRETLAHVKPVPPKGHAASAKPIKRLSPARRFMNGFVGILCALSGLVLICWVGVNVHPSTDTGTYTAAGSSADIPGRLSTTINNQKSNILQGLAYIKKVYKIAENAVAAPEPDPYGYGSAQINDPSQVNIAVQKARDSGLLSDGERVIFSPDVDFYYDKDIKYYVDDSILVICWKEVIDGTTCTFSEVKVADASQFRRKFVNDTFSASAQDYASNIARSVNAVVAMNADFYAFRDFGIVVYQRQLFRMKEDANEEFGCQKYNCVDTLFVNDKGDFSFFHRYDTTSQAALEKYIKDNNILFSVSFGPILVENGEVKTCDSYPAGEVNSLYSRAGIAQVGERHYLYMSVNHSPEKEARWTVNQFAQHFAEKGVDNAYCLDGGQTSEVVFEGQPYNYIDFGAERTVTDIIYFGTAISGEGNE